MKRTLILLTSVVLGLLASQQRASAWGWGWWTCGYAAYVGYPYQFGSGAYGSYGAYYYPPYYPWFAYYNYSHSPYAWPGGYLAGRHPAYLPAHPSLLLANPVDRFAASTATAHESPLAAAALPATLIAELPEDAELLFNGVPAQSVPGKERVFITNPLPAGQTFQYTLTSRMLRDGEPMTISKSVRLQAGDQIRVILHPGTEGSHVASQ